VITYVIPTLIDISGMAIPAEVSIFVYSVGVGKGVGIGGAVVVAVDVLTD
jgi:hypothetical protein